MFRLPFRASLAAALLAMPTLPVNVVAQLRPADRKKMPLPAAQTTKYSIDQFMSPASPLEVSASKKADRIAWVTYERGMRNINGDLNPKITTLFLMPPRDISEISSSMVKGLIGPDGWQKIVKQYVPEPVYRRILKSVHAKSSRTALV